MPRIRIQKKNPAGEVTLEYEGEVIHQDRKSVTVEAFFTRDDMPFMNVMLKKGDRFVETFYTDRWYNIFEIHDREDGTLKGWYCNIGKPASIEHDTVSYIDLALDVWMAPDGTQTVLDEDELEALGLDEELKQKAYDGLHELQTELKIKNPPV
jgi:predicted RNA-binding protein associated with RNAse of E/G family